MLKKWERKQLVCRSCKNELAELDIEGPRQNVCPFCGDVESCEPIEEASKHQSGAE